MGRVGMKGHFQERVFVLEKQTGNIVSCLDGVGGGGVLFLLFHISLFVFLLTVARSCVLDFQQHPHRTSSLLHGTFAGICGVVAGAHRLVRPALRTGLVAERAATPAHPSVPQTLLPCTALDVLTWLGLWTERRGNQQLGRPPKNFVMHGQKGTIENIEGWVSSKWNQKPQQNFGSFIMLLSWISGLLEVRGPRALSENYHRGGQRRVTNNPEENTKTSGIAQSQKLHNTIVPCR